MLDGNFEIRLILKKTATGTLGRATMPKALVDVVAASPSSFTVVKLGHNAGKCQVETRTN